MSGCDNNCDAFAGLHEAAENLIQYSKLIESWLNGKIDETVDIGGVPTPTLLHLIDSIRQFVGVWPDGETIRFCPDKKIFVPLKDGGGIIVDKDGLHLDPAHEGKTWCVYYPGIADDDASVIEKLPTGALVIDDEDDNELGGDVAPHSGWNSEIWITESGTFTAPVTGWYEITAIGGGAGGFYNPASGAISGASAEIYTRLIRLNAGDTATIKIGAGATNIIQTTAAPDTNLAALGGKTSFQIGNVIVQASGGGINYVPTLGYIDHAYTRPLNSYFIYFPGQYGGHTDGNTIVMRMSGFGAGGSIHGGTSGVEPAQGCVHLRYYDPAKNNGSASDSSYTISHKATRTANLYDPETGQGSVWREEDAPAKLAEGLITQEAWEAICAQKEAAARAAWLANPDTEAERFEMLRVACKQKLSQTDKFAVPDYPITEEQRQAVLAYRQAIRDLNHEPGAPWDGGGEATPWPDMPALGGK